MLIQILVIQIITFALLILSLRILFMRHLNNASAKLNALLEENLVKETQLTEELNRAKEERDAEIKRGKIEAAAILEEAKNEAVKSRLKMEEEAKLQIDKILAQAKEDAGKFKESILKEAQNQSLELAVKIIETAFNDRNKEDLQIKFINETIEEIAKLPQDKFTVSADIVKVISSFPLQETQKENLKKVLQDKLGGAAPNLDEAVKKELISGLLLEMNGLVIDGTLKNKLRKVIPLLREK